MSNIKKKVIKLYVSKNIPLKKDETDDLTILKLKNLLQKIIGNDLYIIVSSDDTTTNMFTHEDADILVILDESKMSWYKGKDIAEILGYRNTKNTLFYNITEKYKKTYSQLKIDKSNLYKTHPQTIFINNSGLFQLISSGKKKESKELWEFITKSVIPNLFTGGIYILPPKHSDIDELNKITYNDVFLRNYRSVSAIYLAYIGEYDDKHILKFGKTSDFAKKDVDQYKKIYKKFNVIRIWKTLANDLVKELIKINFACKQMLIALYSTHLYIECGEVRKRELIVVNEIYDLDYCLDMIDTIVQETDLIQENKYHDKIKNIKQRCKLLEMDNKHINKTNKKLKEKIKDLQNNQIVMSYD
jgi:prophage antirepressor-like protein